MSRWSNVMRNESALTGLLVVLAIILGIALGFAIAPAPTTLAWTYCATSPRINPDTTIDILYVCHKDSTIVVLEDVPPLGQIQSPTQLPPAMRQRSGG